MASRGFVDVGFLRNSYDFRVGLPIVIITAFCFIFVMASPLKPTQRVAALRTTGSSAKATVLQGINITANYSPLQHLSPVVQTNAIDSNAQPGSLPDYANQAADLNMATQIQTMSPQTTTSASESTSLQSSLNKLQSTGGLNISIGSKSKKDNSGVSTEPVSNLLNTATKLIPNLF